MQSEILIKGEVALSNQFIALLMYHMSKNKLMLQDTMDIIENWIPRHKVIFTHWIRENTHHDKSLVAFTEWSFITGWTTFNFSSIKWKLLNFNSSLLKLWRLLRPWTKIIRWLCKRSINSGRRTSNRCSLTTCTDSSAAESQPWWECSMLSETSSTTMRRSGTESLQWWTTKQDGPELPCLKDSTP